MLIGYRLSIRDDESYFLGTETFCPPRSAGFHDWRFGTADRPHPATCPTCSRKTDPNFINRTFRVSKRRQDLAIAGDGFRLVSQRFRDFCESQGWSDLEFIALPADPDFFVFRATRKLTFDAARRETRFENPCPTCKAFYNVIGATPVYLVGLDRIPDGLFRTDLEFGSGHGQKPLLLTGIGSAELLRQQKFKGLTLSEISDEN